MKLSEEHKKKLSEAHKGKVPWNKGKKFPQLSGKDSPRWKGGLPNCVKCGKKLSLRKYKYCKSCTKVGSSRYNWKGENASYTAKHIWIKNVLGSPNKCEICESIHLSGHKIHWANISGEYKRDEKDWMRLCVPCHSKYDRSKKN